MAKFLVVGDATVDQMYFVEEFPDPGTEVSAYRSTLEPGGSGGTVATVLARLGNETAIATRVGSDPFADVALRNLVASGVDISRVQRDDRLQNSAVRLTAGWQLNARDSVKVFVGTGISTRTGTDFDTVSLAWQRRWGGGL